MRALPFILLALASVANAQAPAAAPAAQEPPITLHVGDPAPQLTIVKWLKGTPQTNLNDGKVRVVEFWATWCGPCKVGMPHLSELAAKYGDKVAFTGVDASESTDDVNKAQAFVDQAKGMMAYNVAYATPRGVMSDTWMKASGQKGIPCAFVVDKHGKIAWIGHPLMGLEEALDLAVDDKLTPDAGAAISKGWDDKLAKGQETYKSFITAMKAGQTDEATKLNEEVATEMPFMVYATTANRYVLLTAKDPKAAADYGQTVLREKANAPIVLQQLASAIVNNPDVKGARDYALADALLQASFNCSAADYGSTTLRAKIAYGKGDKGEAVRIQEEAIKMLPEGQQYDRARAAAAKTLEEYKGAK